QFRGDVCQDDMELDRNSCIKPFCCKTLPGQLEHFFVASSPSGSQRPRVALISILTIESRSDSLVEPKTRALFGDASRRHRDGDHEGGRFWQFRVRLPGGN